MIRTLHKPLLKDWAIAQALRPTANPTRSFSRYSGGTLHTLSTPLSRESLFTSPSTARITNALYSTVPDVKTKVEVPLPSTSTAPRKPKVDLRPAPKRLDQEPRATHPTGPPAPVVQANNAASSTVSARTTVEPPKMGLLQTAEADISDATARGILKPPPEGASWFGRVFHQGKQLFWFYWSGLKLVFGTHRRQANAINQRVNAAKARGEEGAAMTRWESRFIRNYKSDVTKLLPFILTIIIAEELLPVLVIYMPGILPSTCLLTSQRERIEAKRQEKQVAHALVAKAELQRLKDQPVSLVKEEGLGSLTESLTNAVSGILAQSTWGPLFLQRRRITRHLAYLSSDDALLVKEDMGSRLKEQELLEALEERGIVLVSPTPQYMLEKLQWWLKGASDDKARLGLVLQVANETWGQGK